MTGCAMAAFIPPAYFAGISTTRHMVGSNLATLLALILSVALAVSMGYRAVTRALARPGAPAAGPGDPAPVTIGPAPAGYAAAAPAQPSGPGLTLGVPRFLC